MSRGNIELAIVERLHEKIDQLVAALRLAKDELEFRSEASGFLISEETIVAWEQALRGQSAPEQHLI